ncbi:NAD-dependent protein deacylase [bioreactor metagenome]|uniref:NAD-dependent protein deacylase n=1 Tax=bioreactor metagenome TaxID=1076179 RepID=A0A645FYY7_9ZZZZ
MKKHIVVFTGSGISAESGIRTFRDTGGLWEEHRVEDVATPQGWAANKKLVLEFYNQRRKQLIETTPNKAHILLAELEAKYKVTIITQNVDDLHERAGSSNVVHLHGELRKSCSTVDKSLVYPIDGWELNIGDKCEKGSQLRPYIVWFGEAVPKISDAVLITETADIFCVIGTSLNVYPAASLLEYVPKTAKLFLIDPNPPDNLSSQINVIGSKATDGVEKFIKIIDNE